MIQSKSLRQMAQTLWHVQRIKRLVRDQFGHGAQLLVSVQETICTDPRCEGPATVVRSLMLDFRDTRATIHKPLVRVTSEDIAQAI